MPRPRPDVPDVPLTHAIAKALEADAREIVNRLPADTPVYVTDGPTEAVWTDPDGTQHAVVAKTHAEFVQQLEATLEAAADPEVEPLPAAPTSDEPEDPLTLANLARIESEPYGYLRGDAGTGKSYLARTYQARHADSALLVATTGIAAVNLGGTTINSLLRYYDTESMETEFQFGRIEATLRQLAKGGITRLIVDEISMMDGTQLDILSLALDRVNEELEREGKPIIGVWLTGDFAQLPPVGVDSKKKQAPGLPPARPPIYAFNAKSWAKWADNTMTLTEIRRQADPAFIRAIQQLRTGDKACVEYFRQFIVSTEDANYEGTTIVATNAESERYNALRMMRIDAPEETFRMTRGGQDPINSAPSEWKNIPETLKLKPGCLVMILANRRYLGSEEMMYANGDLAIYLRKLNEVEARVRLLRNDMEVTVESVYRERLKPGTPKRERRKDHVDPEYILASIDYMPLRVAYASTVHKSQGLSLDKIQLLINSQFWMSSGMMYVGLSRARTPQGIRIVGTADQFAARVRVNPKILAWV